MANLKVNTVSGIGTEGPVLDGGLHFRSKNYLTLPKGTTAERTATSSGISTEIGSIRYNTDSNKMECYVNNKWMIVSTSSPNLDGGARALFAGGLGTPGSIQDRIDFITISTQGDATDFGNLTGSRFGGAGGSSRTRGVFMGGGTPTRLDNIDFVTIASTGNAADFGNLTVQGSQAGGMSNQTRALYAGRSSSPLLNTIDFVTIVNTANALDFGDLSAVREHNCGTSSPTRGLIAGGITPSATNQIEFITIASTGDAQDFGDLNRAGSTFGGGSGSTVRGIFAGGYTTDIEYVTYTTLGNAMDFGDMTDDRGDMASNSDSIRSILSGGLNPSRVNSIDFITIMSEGNGVDFGDLNGGMSTGMGQVSSGHGGL